MAVLLRQLASQASSLRLIGASTIALAAALGANPAQAQNAFQGNPTVESGSVTFGGTVGQDTITVASNQAVINWAPNDTSVGGPPIDFLPVGNLALFVNDATLANDFTVLNRILPLDPTRAVALNGTIQSRFEDMVSGALTPGGGVWFYSPGGVVVGGTAVIDVGRLALTTADPVRDTGGNFIMSGQTVFQPAVSGTGVIVNPGASITASPENSYIALVAPYVRQNGSVNVNGSAAYVAVEAATVTVNQGLFDIVINQGSDGDGGNVAITHNGATTGPASAGVGDNHRIYMVAVPKNTAISMLVQASAPLGFDIAGAANVDGNAVVLSGGQGVSDRTFDATPGSTQIPTVNLINTSVTSALHIKSSGSTSVLSNTGPMNFASTALILGNNQALAEAIGINASLNFANGVTVSADNVFTGGEARLVGGAGGTVNVTGDASITANAIGPVVVGVPAPPVTFQGGITLVQANGGGAVNITGNLFNSADALAATYNAAGDGNNAIGGNARFFVNGAGSSAQVDGTVTLTASGFGSASLISGSGVNGNGTGGLVELNADSAGGGANSLTINGAVTLDASGNGASTPLGNAGIGLGGTAGLGAGVNGTVTALGTVSIFASGQGGSFLGAGAGNGGAGTGGIARLTIFGAGGSINASTGITTVDAAGFGGAAGPTGGGNGGNGTGGQALIFVPMGSVSLGSSLVSALGSAGAGTNAPLSQGGNASVIAEGSGTLALGNTSILANSIGSSNPLNAGLMGGATGGAALLTSRGAATLNVAGNVGIMANATGPGGLPIGVTGGAMQGGSADLIVAGTSVATITGAVQVFSDASANAVGGATSAAGSAQGGLANLAVNNTAQLTINGLTRVAAFGNGGLSINGPSGNGTGGTSNIQVNGGTLTINNDAQAVSRGNGGADAVSTQGGNAQGGNARIVANGTGGLITITGAATAESNAIAGFGLNGGNGTGGTSAISQGTGGRVAITGNANVEANGSGAIDNGGGDGIAGTGRGGDARITVNDNTLTIGGNAVVNANGSGGGGSSGAMTGGAGIGGLANIGAQASILTVTGASTVSALGRGGNSGTSGSGGAGTGGQALVGVVNGAISEIRLGGANTNVARGEGGSAIGAGNSGGIGTGGTAQVFATTGAVRLNGTSSISDASASGGSGGAGANGGAATGGFAQYVAIGGTIAAAGSAIASANGFSGSVLSGTGNTGTATGGTALIGGGNHAGSMTIGGQAQALASATGGALNGGTAGLATAGISGFQVTQNGSIQVTGVGLARALATGSANTGGSGGNAQGGTAVLVITGGTGTAAISVGGNALIDARAVGGVGQGTNVNGGNATGGNARVNAFDGDMTFTSGLDVRAAGLGGSVGGGGSGNGGNGVGGNATVAARNGDIAVTGLTNTGIAALPQVSIFAFSGAAGGNGAGGGNGGNATGGTQTVPNTEGGAQIVALNGATSASSITAASAWANASAGGGLGGAGVIGGAGGNATGGTTLLLGSAGNGQINFGLSVASTPGNGGRGGDGTTQGGAGGNAIGGFDQMGTQSGINNTASNTGSASLGTALLFSAATGGTGGNASAGTGGAGGDATGGSGVLLVRGSQVSAAPLTLTATAQGGNGGTGTVAAGAGGDAISSGAGIFASQRFQTTQRGTLTAGATTINAGATAGLGSTNGQAFTRDGSVLSVTQADATLASFTLNSAAANEQAAVSTPAEIIVRDGNLTVTNGLLVAHDGDIAVQVSNGALNAGSFAVDGDNFVVSPSLPNPPAPGTITAGTINILSDDALIVQANLAGGNVTVSNLVNGVAAPAPVTLLNVSATDFSVQSRGAFTAGNITASNSGNGVFFGSVDVGDISAPELSIILPAGDISTGAITVTGDLLLETANGNITTGTVTGGSDSDADFDASGNIITGNVTTGDSITAQAGGTIQMGNLSAGIVNPSPAAGAGYGIGVAALGNVALGNLEAGAIAGLASVNGSVSTGTISVGDSVLALVGQDFSTGAITAGNGSTDFVYLADSSMLALGGPIDNFDPTPIFAATPVRSSGAISTGAISGGNVLAAAGTNLATSGAITGSQRVALDAGGAIDLQGNVSAPQIGITASNLNLGTNARLGTASTASLRLTANSGTGLLFGGTPTTLAVFQIDGSEAQRLQAQNINVQAGSIEIRDVTLLGSVAANPNLVGGNGRLAISASGNISVTGAFAVDQMANTNEVAINADRLAVVTDQGSIILSGNSPGGTLSLRANDIHVARQNILTQLASNVNFAGRDAALAQGTGAGTPSLQAHQINLSARNSLLIQNNGSASEFAGFTAYNDGVNVTNIGFSPTNPAASTRLDMVIYGNLIDIDTGLVTADGSIRDTIIDRLRVGEFSLTSSINGCLLSADACFASHDDGSGNILSGIEDRQESEDEEEKERDEEEEVILAKAASSSPIQPPVTIIDSRPMIQQPLLDDPITGGGNPAQVRPNPTNSSGE